MFDFIIEIPPEFCYGVIESINGSTITLTRDSFAPGIWAGANKMWMEIKPTGHKILVCSHNLETRELGIYGELPPFSEGLELYRIE